jgi:hypothetical protein
LTILSKKGLEWISWSIRKITSLLFKVLTKIKKLELATESQKALWLITKKGELRKAGEISVRLLLLPLW